MVLERERERAPERAGVRLVRLWMELRAYRGRIVRDDPFDAEPVQGFRLGRVVDGVHPDAHAPLAGQGDGRGIHLPVPDHQTRAESGDLLDELGDSAFSGSVSRRPARVEGGPKAPRTSSGASACAAFTKSQSNDCTPPSAASVFTQHLHQRGGSPALRSINVTFAA